LVTAAFTSLVSTQYGEAVLEAIRRKIIWHETSGFEVQQLVHALCELLPNIYVPHEKK
jgi:hypothetical protein